MTLFKCKMCGGDLAVNENLTVGTCNYCGSTMTLPRMADEQRTNLYNRANHFRRNNEFDKASGIYESILNQDNTEAEAYWGLVLCKYGIEYVEDPISHKRVPTCHRTQFGSILADADYRTAIENADAAAKAIYEEEATTIDAIQKQILDISSREEPFDVFICYKETNDAGTRTPDSVLGQDLYYQLKQEGFKVFFSRITLEDKLGTAYEPYIFAALNSSKVMVVIGTKPEFINAVWVKNEWSRYLDLIKKGDKKTLIPAYRDMDPYDLPDEFSHLQAQDMARLGFMQDLVRGIKKLISESRVSSAGKEPEQSGTVSSNVKPLLERSFICLEDGDFKKADTLLEQVLNFEPRNALAYVGKLMVELEVRQENELVNAARSLTESNNYQKALRFADEKYKTALQGYDQAILDRLEHQRLQGIYHSGLQKMTQGGDERDYLEAADIFASIPGYEKADELTLNCREQAKEIVYQRGLEYKNSKDKMSLREGAAIFRKIPGYKDADNLANACEEQANEIVYKQGLEFKNRKDEKSLRSAAAVFKTIPGFKDADYLAIACIEQANEIVYQRGLELKNANTENSLPSAAQIFKTIPEYRNADELVNECDKALETVRLEKEKRNERKKRTIRIVIGIVAAMVVLAVIYTQVVLPRIQYNQATELLKNGSFQQAAVIFESLGDYSDAHSQFQASQYNQAAELLKNGKAQEAGGIFENLGMYSDARIQFQAIQFDQAALLLDQGKPLEALKCFNRARGVSAAPDELVKRMTKAGLLNRIVAGIFHTLGLKADGSVVAVGLNNSGQLDVSGWKDIVAITAGASHTVGLKADGSVVAIGLNTSGQLDVSGWKDIVAIAAGGYHTVGLKADGSVVAVGLNNDGQLDVSGWKDIVAIAAGGSHTVGLKADGSLVAVGSNLSGQLYVSGWKDVVAITAGAYHTVGLKADGTVVAVGSKSYGHLDVSAWNLLK